MNGRTVAVDVRPAIRDGQHCFHESTPITHNFFLSPRLRRFIAAGDRRQEALKGLAGRPIRHSDAGQTSQFLIDGWKET